MTSHGGTGRFTLLVGIVVATVFVFSLWLPQGWQAPPSSECNLASTFSDNHTVKASSWSSCSFFEGRTMFKPGDVGGEEAVLAMLAANAERKCAERNAWLGEWHGEAGFFNALQPQNSPMYYMFTPSYACSWTFEKKPSSAVRHDGGKWVCGLQELHQRRAINETTLYGIHAPYPKNCVVYSFGSNGDFTFEKHVRTVAPGCELHTFDPTYTKKEGIAAGAPFYTAYHKDYGLGGLDDTSAIPFPLKTLETIMGNLGHKQLDILKFDVEGYEWDVLAKVNWGSVKAGQLLVELHPHLSNSAPSNAKEFHTIFSRLESMGYFLVSMEPVTKSDTAQVECVFLHRDWRPQGWPEMIQL